MAPTQDLTRQLHENLWLVLSFAFGQPVVAKFVNDKFRGELPYLRKTIYQVAEASRRQPKPLYESLNRPCFQAFRSGDGTPCIW